eukprot:s1039_g10.t1
MSLDTVCILPLLLLILALRDYLSDVTDALTAKDPDFRAKDMSLWSDHCQSQKVKVEDSALEKANNMLESLSADARKAAWEHDCLLLAKDTANIAKLYSQCERTEKANRLKKITHMRTENTIGSAQVESFMAQHACHKGSCETSDLVTSVDQFIAARKPSSGPPQGVVVWADLTKFGRMDNKQLNFAVAVLDKVLSKNPTTGVGIVLAPHLVSEKVTGGLRGEIRRIEDKLDSRRLGSQFVTLRMEAPPSSKRVSMNMWGWLVWQEDSWPSNVFRDCELATLRFDKTGQQLVVAPTPPPPTEQTVQQLTWDGEPTSVQDLLNCYNLECKCLARPLLHHLRPAKEEDKTKRKLRLGDAKEASTSKDAKETTTLPLTASASTPKNNPTMTPADVEKLEDKVKSAQTRAKGDAKLSRQQFLRAEPTAKDREKSAVRKSALKSTDKPKDTRARGVHVALADKEKVEARTAKKAEMEEKENGKAPKAAPKRRTAAKTIAKKAKRKASEDSNTLDSEEPLSDVSDHQEESESEEPKVEKTEACKKVKKTENICERERLQLKKAEARKKVEEKEEQKRLQLEKAEARKKKAEEKEERKRLQLEKAEARMALKKKAEEKEEQKRLQLEKAEARRKAEEKEEQNRLQLDKAEARRKAEEKEEQKRLQLEKAEARRKAEEKEERKRLQLEKAETLRKAEEKEERKRLQLEKAEARKKKAEEKEKSDELKRLQLEKAQPLRNLEEKNEKGNKDHVKLQKRKHIKVSEDAEDENVEKPKPIERDLRARLAKRARAKEEPVDDQETEAGSAGEDEMMDKESNNEGPHDESDTEHDTKSARWLDDDVEEDSQDSDPEDKARWRSHPERVASIKSMTSSELSRRRLKTYVSDPPLPPDDAEMEASRQEEELEEMSHCSDAPELADPAEENDPPVEDDTLEYEASIAGSECGNNVIDDADQVPSDNESLAGDNAGDDVTDGEESDA